MLSNHSTQTLPMHSDRSSCISGGVHLHSTITPKITRECLNCDKEFTTRVTTQLFCTLTCLEEYNQDSQLEIAI